MGQLIRLGVGRKVREINNFECIGSLGTEFRLIVHFLDIPTNLGLPLFDCLASSITAWDANPFHVIEVMVLVEIATRLTIMCVVVEVGINPSSIVIEDVDFLIWGC